MRNRIISATLLTLMISGCDFNAGEDKDDIVVAETNIWSQATDNDRYTITLSRSKNNTFKVTYRNTDISNNIYSAYIDMNPEDNTYESKIRMTNEDLYGGDDYIDGEIIVDITGENTAELTLDGLTENTGEPVVVIREVMLQGDIYTGGREADYDEISRVFTSVNSSSFDYLGDGVFTVTDDTIGCTYTAKARVSGFRIYEEGSDWDGAYKDWAFDFTDIDSNCENNEPQSGMINIHMSHTHDELEVVTFFKNHASYFIGIAPVDTRPIRD